MKTETWVDPRPINWLAIDFQQSIIFLFRNETRWTRWTTNNGQPEVTNLQILPPSSRQGTATTCKSKVSKGGCTWSAQIPTLNISEWWNAPQKSHSSVSGCIRMASMIFRWQAQKSPKIRADFRSDKKTSHLHGLLPPNQHTGSTSKRNNRQLTVASKWLFKDLIWTSLSWGGSYFRRLCLNRRSIPWRDMAYK